MLDFEVHGRHIYIMGSLADFQKSYGMTSLKLGSLKKTSMEYVAITLLNDGYPQLLLRGF